MTPSRAAFLVACSALLGAALAVGGVLVFGELVRRVDDAMGQPKARWHR